MLGVGNLELTKLESASLKEMPVRDADDQRASSWRIRSDLVLRSKSRSATERGGIRELQRDKLPGWNVFDPDHRFSPTKVYRDSTSERRRIHFETLAVGEQESRRCTQGQARCRVSPW